MPGIAWRSLHPQRGQKYAFLELVEKNAKHSFLQRFRVLRPSPQAIAESLESALVLPEPPKRIECFDISHIQGSDTVASMVVWEDGRMKKSDYRKFIIRGQAMPEGPEKESGLLRDDFASMREAVERRYRRVLEENKPLPSLILIDGGIGQLHAAAEALDKLADHQPAHGQHREEGRNSLRAGPRRRTHRPRPPFAGAAPDPADSRRNAPLRRDFSPPAPLQPAAAHFAHRNSRSRRSARLCACCAATAAWRACASSASKNSRRSCRAIARSASTTCCTAFLPISSRRKLRRLNNPAAETPALLPHTLHNSAVILDVTALFRIDCV